MALGRTIWTLAAGLAASAIVVLGAYAQAHGRWGVWDLMLAAPWPYVAYRILTDRPAHDRSALASRAEHAFEPHEDLPQAYRAAAEALAAAVGAKDSYIHPHSNRVPQICELLARELALSEAEIGRIRLAALVRDVGKLGVPDYILLKPGPLDAEEFAKMRNHAAIGARLLKESGLPDDIIEMVLHHHEKHDGSGYPDHLAGGRIPLGSRMIAVAVVYDALVSDRSYREGWSHSEAIEHIHGLSGAAFDPDVVEAFLAVEPQIQAIDARIRDADCAPPSYPSHAGGDTRGCAAIDSIAQANRELISLFDIAQTLSSTLEMEEVLALLANRTRRLLQASTCVVFVADRDHPKSLTAKAAAGRFEDVLIGARARCGRGTTGKAAAHMEPRLGNFDPNDVFPPAAGRPGAIRDFPPAAEAPGAVRDFPPAAGGPGTIRDFPPAAGRPGAIPDFPPAAGGPGGVGYGAALDFKSCVVAPITSYGELLGTINVYDVSSRAFTHDEVRILSFVAHEAGLALQNARAFEDARDCALRDPLTNLRNGRFLRHCLERELSRCGRLGEPLSVLGIDLDNFKAVNDLLGHKAGDEVLREVADVFRRELRDYDVIVRNGGDEFVMVLPGTDSDEAWQTAERIQIAVAAYAGTHVEGVPGFGASVGAASYPTEAVDATSLLARADAAMYRDKRSRKQRRLAA